VLTCQYTNSPITQLARARVFAQRENSLGLQIACLHLTMTGVITVLSFTNLTYVSFVGGKSKQLNPVLAVENMQNYSAKLFFPPHPSLALLYICISIQTLWYSRNSSQRDKHKGRVLNQLLKTVGKSCYCCPCQ